MNKTLSDALDKMPNSKMIYINPTDGYIVNNIPDGIKVRKSPWIQKGTFVLSEKDLEEELMKAIEEIKLYSLCQCTPP